MSQSKQRPLPDAEITKKERVYWAEELGRLRQNPNPGLSEFEESITQEVQKRKSIHKLPPLEMAMWPESVLCDIDVSDPEKFNDRFIELPVGSRSHWFWRGLHGVPVLLILLVLITSFIDNVDLVDTAISIGIIVLMFGPVLLWIHWISRSSGAGGARYNRQAQLVHEMDDEGNVAHIPWRHVRPAVNLGVAPSSILMLYAPRPRPIVEGYKLRIVGNPNPWSIDKVHGIFQVSASLHYLDHTSIWSNLQRLEFLRRYMEHGVEAVQPSEEAIRQGLVKKAQAVGETQDMKQVGIVIKYLLYPIARVWYWICLGPWLDRKARNAVARSRWPQEVEDLCGPNPDLRGLDTRPVRSSTRHYYKPTASSWTVVDSAGRPTFAAKGMPPGSSSAQAGPARTSG